MGLFDKKIPTNVYVGAYNGALFDNANNTTKNKLIKHKYPYIGGSKEESRRKLWNTKPKIAAAVDSIANVYGISRDLLRGRLNEEGFIDDIIDAQNRLYLHPNLLYDDDTTPKNRLGAPEDSILHSRNYRYEGPHAFGLDDAADYINQGKVKLVNENWWDMDFENEHGRRTNAATGETNLDNIGITAAILKYMQDEAKKRNPGVTSKRLDEITGLYYKNGNNTTKIKK